MLFYFVISQGREGVVRESAAHASNQLSFSCVEEGRLLPLLNTFFLVLSTSTTQKFIDLLLSSPGYSSQQNLHTAKCELSFFVTVFSVLRFSLSFFSMNESQAPLKAKASNRRSRQLPAVHDEDDPGQNTSPTMLLILSALPASVTSSNSLLQQLVQQKRQSTSSETTHSSAKRKKRDSDESGRAIAIASDKVKTTTSKKVHDSASDEAHPKLQDDDALILFGDYSLVDEPLEPEDELNNDGLLTQITTSLSWSDESGPPVSDKLSKLVNDKFHTEYSVDKRKEILQKYKRLSNCTELFVPKVNPEIWGILARILKGQISE